ncbi:unnamed protein product [Leuciscus chuanchicus]
MAPMTLVVSVLAIFVMMGVQHGGTPGVPGQASLRNPPNQWCKRPRGGSLGAHHGPVPPRHLFSKAHKCYQVFQNLYEGGGSVVVTSRGRCWVTDGARLSDEDGA